MANLGALIRTRKWQLDEKRRQLSELYELDESLHQRLQALASEVEREKAAALADHDGAGRAVLANWLAEARRRRERLKGSRERLRDEITAQESVVAEAFEEFKKIELVAEDRARRAAAREAARETRRLDDIGLEAHRRSRSEKV